MHFLSYCIIFSIIILNPFPGKLPISISLRCSSKVSSCSFVRIILLCHLIFFKFLFVFSFCGRLVTFLHLGQVTLLRDSVSPSSTVPSCYLRARTRVAFDLHLQTEFCRLQGFSFLASGFCSLLVSKASLRGLCQFLGGRGWCLSFGRWSWVLALQSAGLC